MNNKAQIAITVLIIVACILSHHFMRGNGEQTVVSTNDPHVHIIMDLGGVCFETHTGVIVKELGIMTLLHGLYHGISPTQIKKRLYHILHTIKPLTTPYVQVSHDPDGDIIPALMIDWMSGCDSLKILDTIMSAIAINPQWFANKTEKKLIQRLATVMFTPEIFAKSRYIINDAANFVARCKKRGFRVSILSNWDAESFTILYKQHQKFFDQCDTIAISGKMGITKPSEDAYTPFIIDYPDDYFIFVDDQHDNVEAAQRIGMHAILVPTKKKGFGKREPNFAAVEKKMNLLLNRSYALENTSPMQKHILLCDH